MGKVYVLGSLNLDITYYMERLPEPGMTLAAEKSVKAAGGKGLNQAAAVRWSGARSSLIGALGSDQAGDMIRERLEDCGIDSRYLIKADGPTGTAIILVDRCGRNMIVVDGGVNQAVPLQKIQFEKGDYLTAQLETNLDAVERYFREAKMQGVNTVLNYSPWMKEAAVLFPLTDLLVINEEEASLILEKSVHTPEEALAAGEDLGKLGVKETVITLGENGAVVLKENEHFHIPGKQVPVVDTQGAGDAFLGFLVGGLAQGEKLDAAAARANEIAARCVGIKGSTLVSLEAVSQGRI